VGASDGASVRRTKPGVELVHVTDADQVAAGPEQVHLHQVHARLAIGPSLGQVRRAAIGRQLVLRAEHLDHGDERVPLAEVSNFDPAFGNRVLRHHQSDRLGHRS
jgi:hypothetical protein